MKGMKACYYYNYTGSGPVYDMASKLFATLACFVSMEHHGAEVELRLQLNPDRKYQYLFTLDGAVTKVELYQKTLYLPQNQGTKYLVDMSLR